MKVKKPEAGNLNTIHPLYCPVKMRLEFLGKSERITTRMPRGDKSAVTRVITMRGIMRMLNGTLDISQATGRPQTDIYRVTNDLFHTISTGQMLPAE